MTSCFKYILELPVATLTATLQAALSESDAAGVSISQHWENIPIDSYTATVDAIPADMATHPSTMELTDVDLGLILHMQMQLIVDINELPDFDKIETETIQKVFAEQLNNILISSTKSSHGHLLGSAGAIEMVATVLSLKYGIIPPTLNYLEKDVNCDLPLVVLKAKNKSIEFAANFSFAFGGLNAILIARAF